MLRSALAAGALALMPALASAQQPCTTDARRVVDEIYQRVLERGSDRGADQWVDQIANQNASVRDVVRSIATSQEHVQRWGNESREQVVRTMYRHVLNREPNGQTLQRSMDVLARSGPAALVDQIVTSPEYQQAYGDWRVPGSAVSYCAQDARTNVSRNNSGNSGNRMRFRRMDANNDGQITRAEWRGNPRSFQNFDWNNDGVLSGEELSVDAERRAVGRDQEEDLSFTERFDYLDVNGDGYIERNEWDGGANAFQRLDTSRDQRLSRAEFDGMNRSVNNFASLDINRDGRIELNEWPGTHRSFDQQDANRDGVLTRDEFRGVAARQF
jgi:Ca2+-binding EF-hand superfamily protein